MLLSDGRKGRFVALPMAGTSPLFSLSDLERFSAPYSTRNEREQSRQEDENSLLSGRDARLGEIMLEVLNAAEGHDALALCRAPAERLLQPIGRVHVWVERGLSAAFLCCCV